MTFVKKKIIMGCDAHGQGKSPYLTRVILFQVASFAIYFHKFHRSDGEDMHDHPWDFVSVLLWRGYVEQTPSGRKRKWPGMVLYRPANWVHRVELLNDKPAYSLVFHGPRIRSWGFHLKSGAWQRWKDYFLAMGCPE